jgi:hypothetical protein
MAVVQAQGAPPVRHVNKDEGVCLSLVLSISKIQKKDISVHTVK